LTPLHFAVIGGDLDIVKVLVANGAKINVLDKMRVCLGFRDFLCITVLQLEQIEFMNFYVKKGDKRIGKTVLVFILWL
jgi:hypothetical protein